MKNRVRFGRLRGRVGLWLLRPFILSRLQLARGAAEAGIEPASYHPDWWWGQYFGLRGLVDESRQGQSIDTNLDAVRAASDRARGLAAVTPTPSSEPAVVGPVGASDAP